MQDSRHQVQELLPITNKRRRIEESLESHRTDIRKAAAALWKEQHEQQQSAQRRPPGVGPNQGAAVHGGSVGPPSSQQPSAVKPEGDDQGPGLGIPSLQQLAAAPRFGLNARELILQAAERVAQAAVAPAVPITSAPTQGRGSAQGSSPVAQPPAPDNTRPVGSSPPAVPARGAGTTVRPPAPPGSAPPAGAQWRPAASVTALDTRALCQAVHVQDRPFVAFVARSAIPRLQRQNACDTMFGSYLALLLQLASKAPLELKQDACVTAVGKDAALKQVASKAAAAHEAAVYKGVTSTRGYAEALRGAGAQVNPQSLSRHAPAPELDAWLRSKGTSFQEASGRLLVAQKSSAKSQGLLASLQLARQQHQGASAGVRGEGGGQAYSSLFGSDSEEEAEEGGGQLQNKCGKEGATGTQSVPGTEQRRQFGLGSHTTGAAHSPGVAVHVKSEGEQQQQQPGVAGTQVRASSALHPTEGTHQGGAGAGTGTRGAPHSPNSTAALHVKLEEAQQEQQQQQPGPVRDGGGPSDAELDLLLFGSDDEDEQVWRDDDDGTGAAGASAPSSSTRDGATHAGPQVDTGQGPLPGGSTGAAALGAGATSLSAGHATGTLTSSSSGSGPPAGTSCPLPVNSPPTARLPPVAAAQVDAEQKEAVAGETAQQQPGPAASNSVSAQVAEFIKGLLDPLYRASLVNKEQYKLLVRKCTDKVMAAHAGATSASFLLKEHEKVRAFVMKMVQDITTKK